MRDRVEQRLLEPSPAIVVLAAGVFTIDQYVYQRAGTAIIRQAPLDWIDHLLTTMFVVWAVRPWFRERWLVPALVASVVIDADHIPGKLGWEILTAGSPRPYTHSLAAVVVLLALAAPRWRGRKAAFGAAIGVCSHLWRDLAEPQTSGVSLLWPATRHVMHTPAAVYLGSVGALAGISLWRAFSLSRHRARVPAELGA
jgi:membrane-bound metal-dependent hydrolase YbcI (DUF457 family)